MDKNDPNVKQAEADQAARAAQHVVGQQYPKWIYPGKPDVNTGVLVPDELAEKAQLSMWENPERVVEIRAKEAELRENADLARLDEQAEAERQAQVQADAAQAAEEERAAKDRAGAAKKGK